MSKYNLAVRSTSSAVIVLRKPDGTPYEFTTEDGALQFAKKHGITPHVTIVQLL